MSVGPSEGRSSLRLLSQPEAAQVLGVSLRTVQRLIRERQLRTVHLGGRTLLRSDDIEALIERYTDDDETGDAS